MSEGLLVKGGTLVLPDGYVKADVRAEEEVITSISRNLPAEGANVIDATGQLVFPGMVDEHVHFREPGLTHKDDFTNGTKAAAAGGVTTVLEMPNTLPPVDSVEKLEEKRLLLAPKAYVDFGLYGVLHNDNVDRFGEMVDWGAVGFKVFLGPTTGNIPPPDDGSLLGAMRESAKKNVTIGFHAENPSMVQRATEEVKGRGRTDPLAHTEARPPICEEEAVQRIALMSKRTGGRALVLHMSAKEGVQALESARQQNVNIAGENCPQYIMLSEEDYAKYGTLIKDNPQVRGKDHVNYLWSALLRGTIGTIGSDHAPHAAEEKSGDVWSCASGLIGVQTILPLMLDAAYRGLLTPNLLARVLSENPARNFNLYPKKGAIKVGSDADLVIVNPSAESQVEASRLYAKYPITPFAGWKLRGAVETTILRGTVVSQDGRLYGPQGKLLKPQASGQIKQTDYLGSP